MTAQRSASTLPAYAAVTTLFFAWGFITSLVDPLVTAVKGIFTLTDVQAQLSAFAFFIAYGVFSFPAAALLARLKAVPSILTALVMMIAGCLIMLVAANLAVYYLVLIGLFVLASGITLLQVAANPLAAALGDPKRSHLRLVFSQTFNSFGTFIGPFVGAVLFLKGVEVKPGTVVTDQVRADALAGIDMAYVWLSGMLAVLVLFFWLSRRVVTEAAPVAAVQTGEGSVGAILRRAFVSLQGGIGLLLVVGFAIAWNAGVLDQTATVVGATAIALYLLTIVGRATGSTWALLGAYGIFLYVGAEVAIGTQMAFFLHSDAVWGQSDAPFSVPLLGWAMGSDGVFGVSAQEAGKAVAFYWGGAMVGRAVGSVLLARFNAAALLAIFTAIAAGMCLYVFSVGGVDAGFVALAIGLFNSIMFPVIFTLTLERSTASEEATSGLLCTAIIGGAFVPLLVGMVSGSHGYAFAMIVPAACYGVLCLFAIAAGRAAVMRKEDDPAPASIH